MCGKEKKKEFKCITFDKKKRKKRLSFLISCFQKKAKIAYLGNFEY